MKALALALLIFFGGLLVSVPAASAVSLFPNDSVCKQAKDSAVCTDKNSKKTGNPISGANGLILLVTRIIATVAGIIAVIMIIVSGFQFIFSGGNSEKTAAARRTILYAVLGLIVIVLAEIIIEFVVSHV